MTTTLSNLLLIFDLYLGLALRRDPASNRSRRPRASPASTLHTVRSGALRHLFWVPAKAQPRLPLCGKPTGRFGQSRGRIIAHRIVSYLLVVSHRISTIQLMVAFSSDVGNTADGMGAVNWQSNYPWRHVLPSRGGFRSPSQGAEIW